jgi:hypothetical protein
MVMNRSAKPNSASMVSFQPYGYVGNWRIGYSNKQTNKRDRQSRAFARIVGRFTNK